MEHLRKFEKVIVMSLIVMMVIVILMSTIELGWIIIRDLYDPPLLLLDINELLGIFGFFLLILIGIELLESIKLYMQDHVVHVEIVLEIALIAVARKVIVLDAEKYSYLSLLGIAALILSLAVAFYAVKRHWNRTNTKLT